MPELKQVYRCAICGNIVEVVHGGKGALVCCNKPMELLAENSVDASKEKHLPVIERAGNLVTVTVGSIEHPMEDKHYIEWIEVNVGQTGYRQFLKPGDKPQAKFSVEGEEISVRAYCNLHGLWRSN